MSTVALDPGVAAWLDAAATGLDTGTADPAEPLPHLAAAGVFEAGVPWHLGGAGGDVTDAVEAIAAVSERSLAAGFVAWGQRTFVEYLLQSPNAGLRERLLADVVAGRVAGATGMSNAMKFLSGLEELQVQARPDGAGWRLDGTLPRVTNLRVQGFHAAAAVAGPEGAFCVALPHDAPGLVRSPDLDLMAMRATSTAALALADVPVGPEHVLHPQAASWLPQVRPAFLGMQCGMSLGLARRALAEAGTHTGAAARHVLRDDVAERTRALRQSEEALRDGLRAGVFQARPAALFQIRIDLAGIAAAAVALELQASGGRAYLSVPGEGFARRWREAAFVPVITPSLVQLRAALASRAAPGRAA